MRMLNGLALGLAAGAALIGNVGSAGADSYNWTGLYVGIQGGGSWGRADTSFTGVGTGLSQNFSGHTLGAFVGAQYQWNKIVLGGEVSFNGLHGQSQTNCPNSAFLCSVKADGMTIGAARLGYAFDRFLPYFKIGYGNMSLVSDSVPAFPGYRDQREHRSVAFGGGLDYALTNELILGVEYMKMQPDTVTYSAMPFALGVTRDIRADNQSIMARLSYKLGPTPSADPVPLK